MVRSFLRGEGGFSLVEMMIAAGLTMAVVGAAVALSTGVQNVYSYELDDAAVQQEARFALDWITRTIAAGASNPYDITAAGAATDSCAGDAPGFQLDPDNDDIDDDIRVLADVNPPNGLVAGPSDCDPEEGGEDVTIAYDSDTDTITRQDVALDVSAVAMTDNVVAGLAFTYLDSSRSATTETADIAYVQISLTVQSKSRNPITGDYTSYTYESEVRVRSQ